MLTSIGCPLPGQSTPSLAKGTLEGPLWERVNQVPSPERQDPGVLLFGEGMVAVSGVSAFGMKHRRALGFS